MSVKVRSNNPYLPCWAPSSRRQPESHLLSYFVPERPQPPPSYQEIPPPPSYDSISQPPYRREQTLSTSCERSHQPVQSIQFPVNNSFSFTRADILPRKSSGEEIPHFSFPFDSEQIVLYRRQLTGMFFRIFNELIVESEWNECVKKANQLISWIGADPVKRGSKLMLSKKLYQALGGKSQDPHTYASFLKVLGVYRQTMEEADQVWICALNNGCLNKVVLTAYMETAARIGTCADILKAFDYGLAELTSSIDFHCCVVFIRSSLHSNFLLSRIDQIRNSSCLRDEELNHLFSFFGLPYRY